MRESIVWTWLNANKPSWLRAERLEVIHPPGLSDVFWTDTRTSISGWLELKYCEPTDKELQAGRLPKIKPEQPMFLRRQAENGVPCGILLRCGNVGWTVWRASPDREWVQMIRSRTVFQHATASWGKQPSVSQVMSHLGVPL